MMVTTESKKRNALIKAGVCVMAAILSVAVVGCNSDMQQSWNSNDHQNDKLVQAKWQKMADKGDARAQFYLGLMYENGQGVEQDIEKAAQWYQLSAEQGFVFAQNNLGRLYYNGQGVEQNLEAAAYWFHCAMYQQDPLITEQDEVKIFAVKQ